MYRLEIFNQALQPVDVAAISETTEIVDDFVSLETYEISVPKLVNVEHGHILRIMDGTEEIALAVVSEAEQTNTETRITAAPIISLLDFDTLEPVIKAEDPTPPYAYLDAATNKLFDLGNVNTSLLYRQGTYIYISDTGAWLVSALAARLKNYVGSGPTDPVYTVNDMDVTTGQTFSTDTIDGTASAIGSLYNPTMSDTTKYKTLNVFDAFTASRNLEGRTFRACFDFSGTRPRLRLYLRKAPASTITIDADAPNIINKDISIVTADGAANRCTVYLVYNNYQLERRDYYRHPDGTIDQTASDLITPVISAALWVDYDQTKTTAENQQYCDEQAAALLATAEQNNKIAITVSRRDKVLEYDTMRALSTATIMHNGRSYTATYTGCKVSGERVTYMFGDVRTELTSKIAISMRDKKRGQDNSPFDVWDAAVPPGYALTSNNGTPAISSGTVSAASAYGAYIIANVGGLGYTSVSRTNGQGAIKTIRYDGTSTSATGASLTIDSGTKWVIAHRTASSQAVLSLSFS